MTQFFRKFYRYFFDRQDVLTIKTLERARYYEPSEVMEEAIFQCLENFFDRNQPLHLLTGTPYEKGPISVERQRELLSTLHTITTPDYESKDEYMICQILLDILEWWRDGNSRDPLERGINVFNHVLDATGQIELALDAEYAMNADYRARLEYVFKHRERLWT